MNWKIACFAVGLILTASLTACSGKSATTNQTAPSPADAMQQGDAMKSDTMKQGDAMKDGAMKQGDAMKDDAMKKTP
jgi:pentapeptide MXKDX repeat protein